MFVSRVRLVSHQASPQVTDWKMLVGSPKNTREIIYLGWTKNRRTIKKQKLIPQIYPLTWVIHILRRQVPRILRGGGELLFPKEDERIIKGKMKMEKRLLGEAP